MDRRKFIAAIGITTFTTGCSDNTSGDIGGSNTTKATEPIDASPEDLLLKTGDFDGGGWSADGVEVDGNTASNGFSNFDTENEILVEVTVYDTGEAAKSVYQSDYSDMSESAESSDIITVKELNIGTESFLYKIDISQIFVRDVNVLGTIRHSNFSGSGNNSKAIKYAKRMQNNWRS